MGVVTRQRKAELLKQLVDVFGASTWIEAQDGYAVAAPPYNRIAGQVVATEEELRKLSRESKLQRHKVDGRNIYRVEVSVWFALRKRGEA